MFADADLKFDQPQAEVVFDRDKLRSQGVDLQPGRPGPLHAARRQLRQPLQHPGPQLQGHSAGQAQRAADAGSALGHLRHRRRRPARAALDLRRPCKTTTEPRELKKFQQLNAVRIQGVIPPPVPLDQALELPRERGEGRSCRRASRIDYAGESRQLRVEGSRFLGTFLLSAILIYLVLAAQFESFRDPFIILAGSVPLAISGRAAVLVPGLHDAQHLQPGRPDHAGRPGGEERHPDRASSPITCRRPGRTSSPPSSRRPARACGRS